MSRYPALRLLLEGYFDEDWSEEAGGDPDVAVTAFARGERVLAPQIVPEIQNLLAMEDSEVAVLLRSLGPYYDVEGDGLTYRGWLEQVAARVQQLLNERG